MDSVHNVPPGYMRPQGRLLLRLLRTPRRSMLLVAGFRQVGKTSLIHQLAKYVDIPSYIAPSDSPSGADRIESAWRYARTSFGRDRAVLCIDDVDETPGWAETVAALWDEDTCAGRRFHVILTGSVVGITAKRSTRHLSDCSEIHFLPYWSAIEMREAFGWDIDRFIFYGGLPGVAALMPSPAGHIRAGLNSERDVHANWVRHIRHDVIERAISRDILQHARLNKPALIRPLFNLCCKHSGEIVPYKHMLTALRDVGNTTTLAHHLRILSAAGLATGLPKYRGWDVPIRASSPKLQVINGGFVSAVCDIDFREARADKHVWDRLTREAIGAHLVNSVVGGHHRLYYWLDRGREVDFVIESGGRRSKRHGREEHRVEGLRRKEHRRAIELRIGDLSGTKRGIYAFGETFPPIQRVTVGHASPGIRIARNSHVSIERFLFEPVHTPNSA